MNQNWEIFDWENDDLAILDMDQTEEKLVHLDFIAEIPGIETETGYKDIVDPKAAAQGNTPTAHGCSASSSCSPVCWL